MSGWREPVTDEEARKMIMDLFGLTEEDVAEARAYGGENDCCNCGNRWWCERAACGHWFCSVCLGRERDDPCVACGAAGISSLAETNE